MGVSLTHLPCVLEKQREALRPWVDRIEVKVNLFLNSSCPERSTAGLAPLPPFPPIASGAHCSKPPHGVR